jgi:hypothetical protein
LDIRREQKDLTPRESDTDKDRMISYDEFLAETKRDEFEKASQIKEDKNKAICDACLLIFFLPFYLQWDTFLICDQKQCCGSGAFLTPGSGLEKKSGSGIRDKHPRSFFRELRNIRAKNT